VWADRWTFGHCKAEACRAKLTFAANARTGRVMPFTGTPVVLRTEMRAPRPGVLRQAALVDLAQSHFATCVDARTFSKKTRRRSA
jgi:hypothetical protein